MAYLPRTLEPERRRQRRAAVKPKAPKEYHVRWLPHGNVQVRSNSAYEKGEDYWYHIIESPLGGLQHLPGDECEYVKHRDDPCRHIRAVALFLETHTPHFGGQHVLWNATKESDLRVEYRARLACVEPVPCDRKEPTVAVITDL